MVGSKLASSNDAYLMFMVGSNLCYAATINSVVVALVGVRIVPKPPHHAEL